MADILHDFPINAPIERVFQAVSMPEGLDQWWTKRSAGTVATGAEYQLWFGPEYDWRAELTACTPPTELEYRMTRATPDWLDTRVGFALRGEGATTQVRFSHRGWREPGEHYRTSCFCWAMYLRILRRYLEAGETVPYERRLEV